MKLSIADLTAKMADILSKNGYTKDEIPLIINMYLGGELRGHVSHGLGSFADLINQDFSGAGAPEVLRQTHSLFMIDAKFQSGNVVCWRAADEAIKRAKTEGMGMAIMKNISGLLRPGAIAEYVADHDLVAIVINSGGGATVAPPGGYDPVTGSNPLAYGVPTDTNALVVDMATSKRNWSQVRFANKYSTDLPPDTFYDDHGNITTDPKQARSVMSFGEYKGFSLAFLIEVLCGSLIGMPMMKTHGNSPSHKLLERGGIIIVIDPSQTTDLHVFKKANSEFMAKVKSTRPRKGETIRIPGEQSTRKKLAHIDNDIVEIPDKLWEELKNL